MGIYYYPADAGLETIGEAETERDYDFDKFVVWRRLADGMLLYATDSGCSCPSPFEDTDVNDLVEIGTYDEFSIALNEWEAGRHRACEGVTELRAAVQVALNERRAYSADLMAWREKHVRVRRGNVPL
jgi:hypothetical protein